MDAQEFRKHAHQAVEDIVNYMENLNERPVLSQVRPGYLRDLIPSEAPKEPEDFDLVMKEFHEKIMPGITHWQSGKFMAYFPSGFSYPSVLGEMYNAMVAVIGFNWINSPAVTELEHVMMDWWVRLLGLGDGFLSTGKGGGVIQNSATDSLIVCMAAATKRQIHALASDEDVDTSVLRAKMVIYGSDQTHSGTAKAARLLGYIHRVVPTDDSCVLKGSVLKAVMDRDVQKGLIPLLITATIGTTGFGSMDDLPSIVEAAKSHGVWVHVDAAYAGNAMVCPEFRHLQQGVEQVDSYIFNPHKWLLLHFDCTCLFLKDTAAVTDALTVRPYYLRYHEHDQGLVEDFSDYQVSLGRRFRSLKVWFTLRSYGESGLQQYVRNHYRLINRLEAAFRADRRFEILNPVHLPLICFRLTPAVCIASVKNRHWVAETVGDGNITTTSSSQENGSSSSGDNGPFPFEPLGIGFRSAAEVAEELVDGINVGRKEGGGGPVLTPEAIRITNERNLQLFNIINQSGIFISKADIHGQVILRVCIGTFNSTDETTDFSWNVIRQSADKLLMASS